MVEKNYKNKFSPYKTIGKEEISAANKVLKSEFYQVLRHQKVRNFMVENLLENLRKRSKIFFKVKCYYSKFMDVRYFYSCWES